MSWKILIIIFIGIERLCISGHPSAHDTESISVIEYPVHIISENFLDKILG